MSGEAPEAAAAVGAHVRLVARNAQGEAPPGPGTLLPHPSECEGRRAWRTRIAVYAMGAFLLFFFIGCVLRCCRFLQRAFFGGGYAKVGGTEAPLVAEAVLNTPFHGGRAVGRAFDDGSDDDEAIARFAEMVADAEAQAPRNGTHKAAEVELLDAAGEAALLGRISALLSTEEGGGAEADGDGGGGGGPLAANARLHWSEGAEAPQLRFAI